jgi:hypothetical protein
VVAKVKERLEVSEQAAQILIWERFNLRKLNELAVRKQYQTKIQNRFATLEHLNDCHFINRAWENIKENIKTTTTLGAAGWSIPGTCGVWSLHRTWVW